jgi:hypothetical protein
LPAYSRINATSEPIFRFVINPALGISHASEMVDSRLSAGLPFDEHAEFQSVLHRRKHRLFQSLLQRRNSEILPENSKSLIITISLHGLTPGNFDQVLAKTDEEKEWIKVGWTLLQFFQPGIGDAPLVLNAPADQSPLSLARFGRVLEFAKKAAIEDEANQREKEEFIRLTPEEQIKNIGYS